MRANTRISKLVKHLFGHVYLKIQFGAGVIHLKIIKRDMLIYLRNI